MELDEELDVDSIEGRMTGAVFGGGVGPGGGCDWDWG